MAAGRVAGGRKPLADEFRDRAGGFNAPSVYWTVRRYIGKGVPPREMAKSADIVSFVTSTPGAVGYVDESEVTPGLNVLLQK